MNNGNYIKKIGSNGYKRPNETYTDKLTPEQIAEKLENYTQVDDITKVPLGSHLRYFEKKDGELKFRLGGALVQNAGLPKFIYLNGSQGAFPVQLQDPEKEVTFFKKMSDKDIKEEHNRQLVELNTIIAEQKEQINNLNIENKKLNDKIMKYKNMK